MNIAELFVKLGITGQKEVKSALSETSDGLKKVGSMSLEAKAGILATVYGLEKLMSGSMQTGHNLMQFSHLTGLNIEKLQQWQYAMQKSGGSAEEFEQSVINLQQSMVKMTKLGAGAPQAFGHFLSTMHIDTRDVKKLMDPFFLMSQLQGYSKKVDAPTYTALMDLMGQTRGMTNAYISQAFIPKNMKGANPISLGEAKNLEDQFVAWKELFNHWEKGIGKMLGKNDVGLGLVKNLEKVSESLIPLIGNLLVLTEKTHLFEAITWSFEKMSIYLDKINRILDDLFGDHPDKPRFAMSEEEKIESDRRLSHAGMGKTLAATEWLVNKFTGGLFKDQIHENLINDPSYATRQRILDKERAESKESQNFRENKPPSVTVHVHGNVNDKNVDKITEKIADTINRAVTTVRTEGQ